MATQRPLGRGGRLEAVVFGAPCGINATHPGIMRVDIAALIVLGLCPADNLRKMGRGPGYERR